MCERLAYIYKLFTHNIAITDGVWCMAYKYKGWVGGSVGGRILREQ